MGLTKEISIVWQAFDIKLQAEEMGIKITDQQCSDVLDLIESQHDGNLGVTWTTIQCAIEETALPRQLKFYHK